MSVSPLVYLLAAVLGIGLLLAWAVTVYRIRRAPLAKPIEDMLAISQRAMGYPLMWTIEGQRYETFEAIESDEHRALALSVVRQLMAQVPELARQVPAPSESMAAPVARATPAAAPVAPPVDEKPRRVTITDPYVPPPQPEEDPYAAPFWRRLREGLRSPAADAVESAPTPAPVLNIKGDTILDQIEEYFQANLMRVPDAPVAHVRSAPDGTMLIEVADKLYKDVEEIPQPTVRQALRQAIQAWERNS